MGHPSATVAAVERACARASTGDELFEAVGREIRRAVPYDAAFWFAVDPITLLATAPARIDGYLDPSSCEPLWHGEFHDQDALLYRDLARAPVPAAGLRAATGGSPVRSRRYREIVAPSGFDDELRAAFRVGDSAWAMVSLFREKGRPAFGADDVAVLSAVSPTVGAAVRLRAAGAAPWPRMANAPGLMFFDGEDVLVSANAEAAEWLRAAYGPAPVATWVDLLADAARNNLHLPFPTLPLLARARAVAAGRERGPARLRLRDGTGRWLVLHASCMSGTPSGDGAVAVVVEPATSADIAPIVAEAYGLSRREREVVGGIARGQSTPELARQLFLSPHTVRDYVKTVFEKVGVSSRGELVAKLFAEHYADPMHDALVHGD
jgi:DNA-binding CsgD family transcriptional regulator